MPVRLLPRAYRRQCAAGKTAPGRDTSWRVAPRPVSGPDRAPGAPAIARRRIAGNIYRRNPDIRSRLSAFTDGTHPPRPRANVTHIGPGQARNARPRGNRSRPGELMILILPADTRMPVISAGNSPGPGPGGALPERNGSALSLRQLRTGSRVSPRYPAGTSLAATPAHTAAATCGDGTARFPSGTSDQAHGVLPPRGGPTRAPRACSRGRSSPARPRPMPVSSSDPRPFRAALTDTGNTDRAGPGFKQKPMRLRTARGDGAAHRCRTLGDRRGNGGRVPY